MSFRLTNGLVGEMKMRITLERLRRELVRRDFVGRAGGITVVVSAYGRLKNISADKKDQAAFYKDHNEGNTEWAPIDTTKLSSAIRAAIWDATNKIRSAKDEMYRRSINFVKEIKELNDFNVWFEQESTTLRPAAFECLKEEMAPEWIRRLREGDGIGSVSRDLAPALINLEDMTRTVSEGKKELAEEELFFWKRVELIRKAQAATIEGEKRPYKDQVALGGIQEEVTPNFVQR